MHRWNGRVALVTGASAAVGASICKELVKHGMSVVGCSTDIRRIQVMANDGVSKGPGIFHAIKCDLEQESDILAMFNEIRREFGRVDVCVNNAGHWSHSCLASASTDEWEKMLKVNILALCVCTRESLVLMKEKNIEDGQIIHMGSILGHKVPIGYAPGPSFGMFNGTKFMVRTLAEALRQELKSTNPLIRVATLSPGAVGSDMMIKNPGDYESTPFYFGPVKGLKPKDIADAVTYIMSAPPNVYVEDVIMQPMEYSV